MGKIWVVRKRETYYSLGHQHNIAVWLRESVGVGADCHTTYRFAFRGLFVIVLTTLKTVERVWF